MPTQETTQVEVKGGTESIILPVGNEVIETKPNDNIPPIVTPNVETPADTTIVTPKVETPAETIVNNTITIDDDVYNVDDKGNAVDPTTGTVFMTKERIDELEGNSNLDIVSQIEAINNIVFTDETGNKITYDSTPQGLAKRELDLVNHVKKEAEVSGIETFLKTNPDIQAVYDYKQKYGTIDGFGSKVDYESLPFDPTNKTQLKTYVVEHELSLGKSKETAKSYADFLEKNNELETAGTAAFNALKGSQVAARQQQEAKFENWAKSYYGITIDNGQVKDLNIPNSLYDMIVKKGEFNGLKIPKDGLIVKNPDNTTTKINNKQLFELAAFADENGNSKLDNIINDYMSKAANKLTIGMYILKGGDLSELATDALNKKQVENTRRIINTNRSTNSTESTKMNNNTGKFILPVK